MREVPASISMGRPAVLRKGAVVSRPGTVTTAEFVRPSRSLIV